MKRKKKIGICFVDDDLQEVKRFRESFRSLTDEFKVGAGVKLSEALKELSNQGIRRPDIVLLDLYYGPLVDPGTRRELILADEELTRMERKLQELLNKNGQSPDGGFELANEVKKTYPGVPLAFFSRKAFLRDALRAEEIGIPVLEKPDPQGNDLSSADPYKAALVRSVDDLSRRLEKMVHLNTWWVRNGEWIRGFSLGLFFFLLGFVWEIWKTDSLLETKIISELTLAIFILGTLFLAWYRHS